MGKMMLPIQKRLCMSPQPLEQRSPPFLAPGTSFMEDNFSVDRGTGAISGWFSCITFMLLLV